MIVPIILGICIVVMWVVSVEIRLAKLREAADQNAAEISATNEWLDLDGGDTSDGNLSIWECIDDATAPLKSSTVAICHRLSALESPPPDPEPWQKWLEEIEGREVS